MSLIRAKWEVVSQFGQKRDMVVLGQKTSDLKRYSEERRIQLQEEARNRTEDEKEQNMQDEMVCSVL